MPKHHRISLDENFKQVVTTLLQERMVEICNNEMDTAMSAYHNDKTCAKLPFIARLVTTRLPHVCDDIVGCLFVKGGRVLNSMRKNDDYTTPTKAPPTAASPVSTDNKQTAVALFFYKTLSGKRAPLLQPLVGCASLTHVTGWKKGSPVNLSDLYVGSEITVDPCGEFNATKLRQQQQAAAANNNRRHQPPQEAGSEKKVQMSVLANELLQADRCLTLKVMWLDETIFQQCATAAGGIKSLGAAWAGGGAQQSGGGGAERIKSIFGVKGESRFRNRPFFGSEIAKIIKAVKITALVFLKLPGNLGTRVEGNT